MSEATLVGDLKPGDRYYDEITGEMEVLAVSPSSVLVKELQRDVQVIKVTKFGKTTVRKFRTQRKPYRIAPGTFVTDVLETEGVSV